MDPAEVDLAVKSEMARDVATPAELVGPLTPEPIDLDRLRWHLPDPPAFRRIARERINQAQAFLDDETYPPWDEDKRYNRRDAKEDLEYFTRLLDHLTVIDRPRKVSTTLEEVLHRALANSYAIRIEGYNPALRQTQIVQAEAAFDAAFFGTLNKRIQDQPTASVLQGSSVDTLSIEGGIRKLLPTGMQASTSLSLNRTMNSFQFQELNPEYRSRFNVEFRQPLLRGFGIDFNRTQIRIAKNDKRIADLAFARSVQDTLLSVESTYWRLFQARRIVVVQARLLATFEQIYNRLSQRAKFDVIPIQINETKAQLESARADYIRICNEVRNAEDQLIALLNDPAFDLADDIEIIPTDIPTLEPLLLDRLGEVQAALDSRQEIQEAQVRVNSAKLLVGSAKNQVLPRMDLIFSYSVDGLGISADDAFDEVTRNDFHEYVIGLDIEIPVGNRQRRAQEREARLQHAQAIASLRQTFEQVILDVNVRVREVLTQLNLIGPNFQSSEASEDRLDSIRVRAESQNFVQLSNELQAVQSLASSRNSLLSSVVEYNIAIIELERAKGTLLDYYNVTIPDAD